jgi:carbon monoxide dehydrogenase subunit G
MKMSAEVLVRAPRRVVWDVVTDIPNAAKTIEAIEKIEVLDRPAGGLVGLKWRETRKMFGKEATEVMWITGAAEASHYETRAESHGAVYTTRIALDEADGGTRLSMTFAGAPQTFAAKAMGFVLGPLMKGSMRKAIQKDLDDIKAAAEARA